MKIWGLAVALLSVVSGAAAAETAVRGSFIKGIYAMEGRCTAWAAIEAGGDRTVETVPETLTEDGFSAWEGGCSFISVKEKTKGRRWVAKMACGDGNEEYEETDTFDLDPVTGNITVTVEGNSSVFVRCDAAKGN